MTFPPAVATRTVLWFKQLHSTVSQRGRTPLPLGFYLLDSGCAGLHCTTTRGCLAVLADIPNTVKRTVDVQLCSAAAFYYPFRAALFTRLFGRWLFSSFRTTVPAAARGDGTYAPWYPTPACVPLRFACRQPFY